MEMSGLEYIGSLAILIIFFYILVKVGPKHNEADDLPEFGWPANESRADVLRSYKRYQKKKKKRKRKKRRK